MPLQILKGEKVSGDRRREYVMTALRAQLKGMRDSTWD